MCEFNFPLYREGSRCHVHFYKNFTTAGRGGGGGGCFGGGGGGGGGGGAFLRWGIK